MNFNGNAVLIALILACALVLSRMDAAERASVRGFIRGKWLGWSKAKRVFIICAIIAASFVWWNSRWYVISVNGDIYKVFKGSGKMYWIHGIEICPVKKWR